MMGDKSHAPHSDKRAADIRIDAVSKRYNKDVVALDTVDLDIGAGEFFTLLGPSGCGKTTMLRVLAGLEPASAGTITIGGRDVTRVAPHKRRVNTVFQSYALFEHLNVRDNVGFGLRMRGVRKTSVRRQVADMAKFIRIDDLLDRRVGQLSGGQKQRVALARALINEPDVLLLDEPLAALDANLRGDLQIELRRIQRRLGMTFVFVTHDQQEAMILSDRMAVLADGAIRQVGPPRQLYEHPANRFVARFMGHHNLFAIRDRRDDRITTDFGELAGVSGAGKHVLIRPESITLTNESADPPNRFAATVRGRVYRGRVIEYVLGCAGQQIIATCHNDGRTFFAPGADVTLVIPPNSVAMIDD